jgi:DNA relaxase NicK
MATRHWLTIGTWAHNVTRFDLQTTLLSPTVTDEHAGAGFSKLALDPRVTAGLVSTKLISSTPDGSTLYVGSRSSDRFFRVYDKTAESGFDYPERSWRYEIEYKGERAKKVADAIRADRHPTQAIWDCLQTAFSSYGLAIPGDRPAWAWRDAAVKHTSDDERRLAWLRRCIRPCVSKLTEAFGVDVVLQSLGVIDEVDELTGEMERTIMRDLATSAT